MWLLSKAVAQHFLGVGLRRLGFKHRADGQKRAEGVSQHKTEASCANDVDDTYHFRNLHTATFKLADFGRAVLFKQLAAEQGTLLAAAPLLQDQQLLTRQVADMTMHEATVMQLAELMGARPAPYILDGEVTLTDPCLRPPEEILGLPYAAPAYDVWRLGCLLAEVAVGVPLFSVEGWAASRQMFPGLQQYSDDAIHLMEMQSQLGAPPRELIRKSPLFSELYYPSDLMCVSKVWELPPHSMSINKQLAAAAHGEADKSEVNELQNFITAMLAYDPAKRPSAAELLQHKFLQQQQQQQQQQSKQ